MTKYLILLQKIIYNLIYKKLFYIVLYIITLLFSFYVNIKIGAFILGSIFAFESIINRNFNFIDLILSLSIIYFLVCIFMIFIN